MANAFIDSFNRGLGIGSSAALNAPRWRKEMLDYEEAKGEAETRKAAGEAYASEIAGLQPQAFWKPGQESTAPATGLATAPPPGALPQTDDYSGGYGKIPPATAATVGLQTGGAKVDMSNMQRSRAMAKMADIYGRGGDHTKAFALVQASRVLLDSHMDTLEREAAKTYDAGDMEGFGKIYNAYIEDGQKADFKKKGNGVVMTSYAPDGSITTREMSDPDVRALIGSLKTPQLRHKLFLEGEAAERNATLEAAMFAFKTGTINDALRRYMPNAHKVEEVSVDAEVNGIQQKVKARAILDAGKNVLAYENDILGGDPNKNAEIAVRLAGGVAKVKRDEAGAALQQAQAKDVPLNRADETRRTNIAAGHLDIAQARLQLEKDAQTAAQTLSKPFNAERAMEKANTFYEGAVIPDPTDDTGKRTLSKQQAAVMHTAVAQAAYENGYPMSDQTIADGILTGRIVQVPNYQQVTKSGVLMEGPAFVFRRKGKDGVVVGEEAVIPAGMWRPAGPKRISAEEANKQMGSVGNGLPTAGQDSLRAIKGATGLGLTDKIMETQRRQQR